MQIKVYLKSKLSFVTGMLAKASNL